MGAFQGQFPPSNHPRGGHPSHSNLVHGKLTSRTPNPAGDGNSIYSSPSEKTRVSNPKEKCGFLTPLRCYFLLSKVQFCSQLLILKECIHCGFFPLNLVRKQVSKVTSRALTFLILKSYQIGHNLPPQIIHAATLNDGWGGLGMVKEG